MRVAGVDGTKGGWVAIVLDDGRFASDHVIQPVETAFEELADAEVIAIDVPIGFGPRKADAAARAYLSGAASTVFTSGHSSGAITERYIHAAQVLFAGAAARAEERMFGRDNPECPQGPSEPLSSPGCCSTSGPLAS